MSTKNNKRRDRYRVNLGTLTITTIVCPESFARMEAWRAEYDARHFTMPTVAEVLTENMHCMRALVTGMASVIFGPVQDSDEISKNKPCNKTIVVSYIGACDLNEERFFVTAYDLPANDDLMRLHFETLNALGSNEQQEVDFESQTFILLKNAA